MLSICIRIASVQLAKLIGRNHLQFGNRAKITSLIPDIALRILKFRKTFEGEVRK